MAHSLMINGININFTASISTLEGKNNGSDVSGYAFSLESEPGNNSTHQYKVISSDKNSLTQSINLSVGDSLHVWTELPSTKKNKDIEGDPTGPRGTEVKVKSGTGGI